jgi:hypothetical protein
MFVAYLHAETLAWFNAISRWRITPRAKQRRCAGISKLFLRLCMFIEKFSKNTGLYVNNWSSLITDYNLTLQCQLPTSRSQTFCSNNNYVKLDQCQYAQQCRLNFSRRFIFKIVWLNRTAHSDTRQRVPLGIQGQWEAHVELQPIRNPALRGGG